MFTITKQDSIVIAVTLAIMLDVPLLIPAFYPTAEITLPHRAASLSTSGYLPRHLIKPKDVDHDEIDSQLCKSFRVAPLPAQI
jgi:hypothetical protein